MKTENKNNSSPRPKENSGRLTRACLGTAAALSLCIASCAYPLDGAYESGSTSFSNYQPGYRITSLPYGYRSENISGQNYYYHNGQYYQRNSGGYVVINAPRQSRYYNDYNRYRQPGYSQQSPTRGGRQPDRRINNLPSGYRSENVNGVSYYYHNGTYYQRSAGGYVVSEPPRNSRYSGDYRRSR